MRAPAFWNIRQGRDAAFMLRSILMPFGWIYGAMVQRRLARATPLRLPIPVISIGNLSVGGTGKTPLARSLRSELTALLSGPVAIVSRGYGGSLAGPVQVDPATHTAGEVGDEPLMLARDGPVFVARDRALGGQIAVQAGMKAIILDDAHQNPSLVKDLNIVVVDGGIGFGNGLLVPAGPLREPVKKGLARADAIVVMGKVDEDAQQDWEGFKGKVLACDLAVGQTNLSGRVLGFCGIGRPEKFDQTLRDLGLEVADLYPFPDHHPYSTADLHRLKNSAEALGATLVTTEKDHVRLPADFAAQVCVVPISAVFEDGGTFRQFLRAALDTHKAQV